MTVIADFTSPFNWNRVYSAQISAQPAINNPNAYIPIPQIEVPFLFESRFLNVQVSTLRGLPFWYTGGWLRQRFNTPSGQVPNMESTRYRLNLKSATLIRFPDLSNSYSVIVDVPYWFTSIDIKIWEFIGTVNDSTEEILDALKVDLSRVELKIDNLN